MYYKFIFKFQSRIQKARMNLKNKIFFIFLDC